MNKRPILYLIIVIILTGFIWAIERPDQLPINQASSQLLVPQFDASKITRIEYEHLLGGIQLEKTGEGWKVAEKEQVQWFPADEARIKQALGNFGSVEVGIKVSHALEHQMLYNVGITGQKVRLFAGSTKIADVVVGKNGPDFMSNYVRREGEDQVYLIDRSLQGVFSADINDWKLASAADPTK